MICWDSASSSTQLRDRAKKVHHEEIHAVLGANVVERQIRGWFRLEIVRASCSKRLRSSGSADKCSGSTLIAAVLSSRVSFAL